MYLRIDKKRTVRHTHTERENEILFAIFLIGFLLFYCFQIAKMLSMKSWCNFYTLLEISKFASNNINAMQYNTYFTCVYTCKPSTWCTLQVIIETVSIATIIYLSLASFIYLYFALCFVFGVVAHSFRYFYCLMWALRSAGTVRSPIIFLFISSFIKLYDSRVYVLCVQFRLLFSLVLLAVCTKWICIR